MPFLTQGGAVSTVLMNQKTLIKQQILLAWNHNDLMVFKTCTSSLKCPFKSLGNAAEVSRDVTVTFQQAGLFSLPVQWDIPRLHPSRTTTVPCPTFRLLLPFHSSGWGLLQRPAWNDVTDISAGLLVWVLQWLCCCYGARNQWRSSVLLIQTSTHKQRDLHLLSYLQRYTTWANISSAVGFGL